MIAVARSSAKLSGAWVPTRDPFNFRKPYKGYTLRCPVRSTQEIRPRKVEKVKKKKKGREESVEERRCGNAHRRVCAGKTMAEWS